MSLTLLPKTLEFTSPSKDGQASFANIVYSAQYTESSLECQSTAVVENDWGKKYFTLDPTNAGAAAILKEMKSVGNFAKKNWGVDLKAEFIKPPFKITVSKKGVKCDGEILTDINFLTSQIKASCDLVVSLHIWVSKIKGETKGGFYFMLDEILM
jgi:hypothetical protein